MKLPVWTVSFGLALAVAPFSLSAQQGTLIGTVTDELTGGPVPQAEIQILGGGETRTVRVNGQGTACITGDTGGFFEQNCVDSFAIFDIDTGYEVLDTGYRSFPGVPHIGRFAMVRVKHDLF